MSRHAGESADTTGMVRHQRLVTPVGGVLKLPHPAKIAAGVVLATGSVLGGAALATTSADIPEPADGDSGSQAAPTQTDSAAPPPLAWSVPEHLFGLDLRLDGPPEFALPPTLTQQAVQISQLGPITPGAPITTPHVGGVHPLARDGGPATGAAAVPPAASGHLVLLAPVTGARRMAASFDDAATMAGTGAAFAVRGAALRSPARQASSPTTPPPPPQRPVLVAAGPVQLAPVVRRPAPPAARESSGSVDPRVAPDATPLIATSPGGGERGDAGQRPSDPAIAVLLAAPIDTPPADNPPADAVPADDTPPADVPVAATDVGVTNRSDVVEPTGSAVTDTAVTDTAVTAITAITDTAITDTAAEDSAVTDTAVTASPADDSPTEVSPADDSPATTRATYGGATVDETTAAATPEAQPVVAEPADQRGDPLGSTASDA